MEDKIDKFFRVGFWYSYDIIFDIISYFDKSIKSKIKARRVLEKYFKIKKAHRSQQGKETSGFIILEKINK